MPTPSEQLWEAVSNKQHAEVVNVIKQNPHLSLVNSLKDNRPLAQHIIEQLENDKNLSLDALSYIFNHPQFDFNAADSEDEVTNIEIILSTGRFDIIKLGIESSRMFYYDNESLSVAAYYYTEFKHAHEAYQDELKQQQPSTSLEQKKQKFEHSKPIFTLLRDATILYAIKQDDANIFDKLDGVGIDPKAPLSDESLPADLLTQNNPRIKKWIDYQTQAKQCAQNTALLQDLYGQLNQADTKYALKQIEILADGVASKKENAEKAVQIVKHTPSKGGFFSRIKTLFSSGRNDENNVQVSIAAEL